MWLLYVVDIFAAHIAHHEPDIRYDYEAFRMVTLKINYIYHSLATNTTGAERILFFIKKKKKKRVVVAHQTG